MREFIYFSGKAWTTGNFKDLMKAGRLDIACHVVIAAFFLSHAIRQDVVLHLVFYGPPDPPKHLELRYDRNMPISKKDVAGLIKRMLYKYKKGEKREVFPGCSIEKKSLLSLIDELVQQGKTIYILDRSGEDIRKATIDRNAVFLLGDHEGLPMKEMKRIKKIAKKISIGKKIYFASHVVAIVNNELDRREEQAYENAD